MDFLKHLFRLFKKNHLRIFNNIKEKIYKKINKNKKEEDLTHI